MYNPNTFRINDLTELHAFVQAHPLGLLITHNKDGLLATSTPFLLYPEEGSQGVLRAHLAKANPHWKVLESGNECLIVFQGAHGYVTPAWYPSKTENHKVVPTWNYSMVQCRGSAQVFKDITWLQKQVSDLTDYHERGRTSPWSVNDAPDDYIDGQIKAIIGIEIPITAIEGKYKLSQNRSEQDRSGVIKGVSDPKDLHYNANVAALMKKR